MYQAESRRFPVKMLDLRRISLILYQASMTIITSEDAIYHNIIFVCLTQNKFSLTHTYLVIVLSRYDNPTPHSHFYSPQTPVHNKAQLHSNWTAPLALHDDLTPSICSSVYSMDQVK